MTTWCHCRFVTSAALLTAATLLAWSEARPEPGAKVSPDENPTRFINQQIAAGWKDQELTPSNRATDFEFIRRASLDIIGRIATPDEIRVYLRDPAQTRRALLIERLLNHEEFVRNWAGIWTVWLMARSSPELHRDQMQLWLEEQLADKNVGHDKIVRELLIATGKTNDNGAVNFILANLGEPNPNNRHREEGYFEFAPLTSRTTRLFLGVQIQCAQCHDHPFNPEWKQHQFWGMNAFFRQVQRDPFRLPRDNRQGPPIYTLTDDPNVNKSNIIYYEKRNGVILPTRPVFLDNTRMTPKDGANRREELANFILDSDYFAKAYVNRIWAHFFGRGLTHPGPIDDFGEHNPPTHPELLDGLAAAFKYGGYKPRDLIRWIANSDAYQLSSIPNRSNEKPDAEPYFARMLIKAMSPEQLFESLMAATQAEAVETRDGRRRLREQWMRTLVVNFGDDEGNEASYNGTVIQALLMMNGRDLNEAISHRDKGTLATVMRRPGANDQTVITELYYAAYNRPPSTAELRNILAKMPLGAMERDPAARFQDLFWALLNSNAFILNH